MTYLQPPPGGLWSREEAPYGSSPTNFSLRLAVLRVLGGQTSTPSHLGIIRCVIFIRCREENT